MCFCLLLFNKDEKYFFLKRLEFFNQQNLIEKKQREKLYEVGRVLNIIRAINSYSKEQEYHFFLCDTLEN